MVSPLGSGILCGFSRLVPRMVPPSDRMPETSLQVQHARMILDEAAKAFLDADDLDVEIADGRLGDAANGGVEARDNRRRWSGCRCTWLWLGP